MSIVGVSIKEVATCEICHTVYRDKGSIDQVKEWLTTPNAYAPCPNISCPGKMVVTLDIKQA